MNFKNFLIRPQDFYFDESYILTNITLRLLKLNSLHTDFPDLCISSIKESSPDLRAANNATVLSALTKAVGFKAREARAYALQLTKDATYDPKTTDLLRDCIDTYDDALDNLDAANEAIAAGDAGTRDTMLSAMISDFGTCEDGFQEFTLKSPMADYSQTLQNMTDNCLAIANIGRSEDDF
ncbi:Pectinesterase inhibitor 1 [Apostasia shenzhenica]|uniref:Pectinesterase inhibitor 1 n=1 Tax=Apostasia shenzhenica TaxID=1088818 RepID=A0A2I0B5C9_9ASPA|nr:Pectinesterase inhibitor 1 [Apostasia shenzhenica]